MEGTVVCDEFNISVDLADDFSSLEKTMLAAQAPDAIHEYAEEYDTAEEAKRANDPIDESVVEYFNDVLFKATELDEDDVDRLSTAEIISLGAETVETIFGENGSSDRRVKRARITQDAMEQLFVGELGIVAGLPQDAALEAFNYDAARDTFEFIFSHPDWEPINEGAAIPEINATAAGITLNEFG